jgi:repressor LexA
MSEQLTPVERRVYHFLIDFLSANTYQPSVREIGREFNIKSTKTVSEILQSLAEKGYIQRDPSRSRGVRLLGYEGTGRTQPLPYYGRIAAGGPVIHPEHREGFITMDRRFVPSEDAFFLRISGDSMNGVGINDGDYVMVQPAKEAKNGDVIAARLGFDATVKSYVVRGDETVLVPANPSEREIVVTQRKDFSVLGRVCGVFRPFHEEEPAVAGALAD